MAAKPFESARIEPNDDGTFTVAIQPTDKPKKGDEGESPITYQRDKRMSAQTLEEAFKKISAYGGKQRSPEEEVADFMTPRETEEEETEEE